MLFCLNEKQLEGSQWQDIVVNLVFHRVFCTVYTKSYNSVKTKLKSIRESYITLENFFQRRQVKFIIPKCYLRINTYSFRHHSQC